MCMPSLPNITEERTNKRLILACLMVGVLLSPLNVNLVSIALPAIRAEYEVGISQIAWLVTGYFVPTVVFMPLFGRLGDLLGKQRVYVGGLLVFSLGAFISAVPPSFSWLFLGRVLQGTGWSGLYPLSIAIITDLFASEQQGMILGIWESAVGIAVIIALPMGGFLVEYINWRTIFVLLGLLGAITIYFVWKSVPHFPGRGHLLDLDWGGVVSLTGAIVFLLMGLTGSNLFSPQVFFTLLATGFLSLLTFIFLERRAVQPFVHLGLFTNRVFVFASLSAALRMIMLMGATVLVPLFLQEVRGLSPTTVGTLLLAYPLLMFPATPLGGRLTDRLGPRWPGVAGLALVTLAVYLLARLNQASSLAYIALALAVRGVGSGVCQAPLARAVTASSPQERMGIAAGLYGMIRYSGLAFGSAIAGTLLESRLTYHGTSLNESIASLLAFHDVFWLLVPVGLIGIASSWFIERPEGKRNSDPQAS